MQGGGKSTYFREHLLHFHVRIGLDLLRTRQARETALARNASWPAPQIVPEKGPVSTFPKLEPPTLDEGFHRLYTLRLNEAGEWCVETRKRED